MGKRSDSLSEKNNIMTKCVCCSRTETCRVFLSVSLTKLHLSPNMKKEKIFIQDGSILYQIYLCSDCMTKFHKGIILKKHKYSLLLHHAANRALR